MNTQTVIIALLGAVSVVGQHLAGNVDDYAQCIDRWLAAKPDMSDRFDRQQIAWLCERTKVWQQRAETKPDTNNDDILTIDQRKWLFNLRTCQGLDCIQNVIQQRCKGRRCRRPPTDGDKSDQPTSDPQSSKNDDDDDEEVESDQILKDFNTIDADSLDFEPKSLFTSDDQEGPDAQTIQGVDGSICRLKTTIARLCPIVLNGTIAETVIPKIIANLESNYAGAALESELEKFNALFAKLSVKCENVQANLIEKSLTFDYFIGECSEDNLRATRNRMAVECLRVLQAKTAHQALPELSRHLQGRTANSNLAARFEKFIEDKYKKWLNRCLSVQEELAADGMSFGSWLGVLNIMRRKRADQALLEYDDDMMLDLNEADFRAPRKEIRQMTDRERQKFFAALNRLKNEKIDGTSMYDLLVIYHTPEESPGAHWGPAFLPFHREWLKQLEVALRQLDPDVAIPYWDSTLDEGLPTPKDAILWTDDFFGSSNGTVTRGPFANWAATHELGFVPHMKTLYRDVGTSPFGGLFKETDIEFAMSRERFEDFTACVDPTFELVHGVVHMFVGGYMADIAISPNDPTFFMHHCFIDFIWEEWRQRKQTLETRENDYPTNDRSCNDFHYGSHQMQPFAVKNIDGLSNNYTREFYRYYPRSRCSRSLPDCGSPYIFCDTKKYRCLSKVKIGGDCTGFEGAAICLGGTCVNATCIVQDNNQATTARVVTTTSTTSTTSSASPPITLPTSTFTTSEATIATTSLIASTPTDSPTSTPMDTTTITTESPTTTNSDDLTTSSQPASSRSGPVPITPITALLTTPPPTSTTPTTAIIEAEQSTPSASPITTMLPQITTTSAPPTTFPTTFGVVTTSLLTPTPPSVAITSSASTPAPTKMTTSNTPESFTTTLMTPPPSSTKRPPLTSIVSTTSSSTPSTTAPIEEFHSIDGDSFDNYSPIGWEEESPFPVVYFTISVVQGEFRGMRQEMRRGAPNCRITVTGLNVPSGYTQSMSGLPYASSIYPQYSSGAIVRAMDPAKAGYFPLVEIDVSVVNALGARCARFCFDGKQYQPCDSKRVMLSVKSEHSDPVAFRNAQELAQTANWAGRGYYRARKEDYLLFQCPPVYG